MSDWKCQGVEDGASWGWGWGAAAGVGDGVAVQLGLGSCCSAKYVKMSFNRKGTKHAHGSICVVMVLKSLAFIQINTFRNGFYQFGKVQSAQTLGGKFIERWII